MDYDAFDEVKNLIVPICKSKNIQELSDIINSIEKGYLRILAREVYKNVIRLKDA